MLSIWPLKVAVVSPLPVPAEKLKPEIPASVKVPLVAVRVTSSTLLSTSVTEIAFPLATEKTSAVSSLVFCATGTVLTGASLTALTVMELEAEAELKAVVPPVPPPVVYAIWTLSTYHSSGSV